MKKKFFVAMFFIAIITESAFSEVIILKGNVCYGYADYKGTTKNVNPNALLKSLPARKEYIEKPTKDQVYLPWQALDTYNYQDGEIYEIFVVQYIGRGLDAYPNCMWSAIVAVSDGGENFYWYGGWLDR